MVSEIKGFERVLYTMQQWHSRRVYNRWLAHLKIVEKTPSSITLTAPTAPMAEEASILFGTTLLAAARQVWPDISCVRIKPAPIEHKIYSAPSQLTMRLAA